MNKSSTININFKLVDKCINAEVFNLKFIEIFSVEKYINNQDEKLELLDKKQPLYNCVTYVWPFGLEPSIYLDYKKIYNKFGDYYLKIKTNFLSRILFMRITIKFLLWGTKITLDFYQTDNTYYYDNNFNIAIIGFIGNSKDFWYPAFCSYDEKFLKITIPTKNINYKDILGKINHLYKDSVTNEKIKGDFAFLAYLLSVLGSEWKFKDKRRVN